MDTIVRLLIRYKDYVIYRKSRAEMLKCCYHFGNLYQKYKILLWVTLVTLFLASRRLLRLIAEEKKENLGSFIFHCTYDFSDF